MALMFPPSIHCGDSRTRVREEFVSEAEIDVFGELNRQLGDDWQVFHSVWIRDSALGEHAEADFVLVGPESILVLEVKGGLVSRNTNGEWEYRNRRGQLKGMKRRGPVDQARSEWYALRNHVWNSGHEEVAKGIVWGYGVVTPDCQISVKGLDPGISPKLWLDKSAYPEKLSTFLDELTAYWRMELTERRQYPSQLKCALSSKDREIASILIRPLVGYVEGAGSAARDVGRQLFKLTREQYKALDFSSLHPRIVLFGGAGTGKTLLALERARREERAGGRVLFICFNKLLASHVRTKLAGEEVTDNITVANYHQLVRNLADRPEDSSNVPENWIEFNQRAPELVLEAMSERQLDTWDYLIVDEGQDLLSQPFFDVLDLLLRNGIEGGRWTICFDPEQALFSDQYDPDFAKKLLEKLGVRVSLTENCRNSREISAYGHGIGRVQALATSKVRGPAPGVFYYSNKGELRREIKRRLNRLVAEFRDSGFDESRIVILLAQREPYETMLSEMAAELLCPIEWMTVDKQTAKGTIRISTVQAFKGLEADAILLVGLERLEADWQRRLFYVAATRSAAVLQAFFPQRVSVVVENAMIDVLRLMQAEAP